MSQRPRVFVTRRLPGRGVEDLTQLAELDAPSLLLTPHIGSASIATRTRMADLAVENLIAGLEGRPLPHSVNPNVGADRRVRPS